MRILLPFSVPLVPAMASDAAGPVVIDMLNPPPTEAVLIVHPDGTSEGGPAGPARPLPPTHNHLINEGIRRLYELAEGRSRFWGPQIRRLREKIGWLVQNDRDSLRFLDDIALHVTDPDSEEAGQLIWLVHKTQARSATWPARIKRKGPVAAVYYFHGPKSPKAKRLTELLKDPRTESIVFEPKNGNFQTVVRPSKRRIQIADLFPLSQKFLEDDRRTLVRLLRSLKDQEIAETRDDLGAIADRILTLREQDEPSYRAFLAAAERGMAEKGGMTAQRWTPLRKALSSTSRFVRRWHVRLSWTGVPFAYFYALARSGASAAPLFNRLSKGNTRTVHFSGDGAEIDRHIEARRTPQMAETTYGYGRRKIFSSLPNPENGWGEKDFFKTEEDLSGEIRAFFRKLEKGLGLTAADIQRTLRIPYYLIRDARTAMTGAHLADAVLDRLELSRPRKEWLRHVQTLLALARDFQSAPDVGPYRNEGRLIRYFRVLHGIKLQDVQPAYRTGIEIEGPTEVELGRVMIDDRAKLAAIAAAIRVPSAFREAFLDHLLASYDRTRLGLAAASPGDFEVFPNEVFALPYAKQTKEEMLELFRAFGREIRQGLTRAQLEKETGLTPSQVHNFETHGDLAFDALPAYETFLKKRGRDADAAHLRSMRAALELKYNPIPDRGAYFAAGRLLRLTRAMMGLSITKTIAELEIRMPGPAYTRWEWGFVVVPQDVVLRYADLLVRKGVLSASELFGFISEMDRLYRREERGEGGRR